MPPFFSGPQFPLAEASSSKKFFLKILSKDPGGVFRLVFIAGLGIKIGHRGTDPRRKTCSGLQQMKPQLMKHLETPILM